MQKDNRILWKLDIKMGQVMGKDEAHRLLSCQCSNLILSKHHENTPSIYITMNQLLENDTQLGGKIQLYELPSTSFWGIISRHIVYYYEPATGE